MGTNGASARVFKEKNNFYRESRSTYRYPFCPEQILIEKRLETCL